MQYKTLGLNFGLNTDDPGVTLGSMDHEYKVSMEKMNFTYDDFIKTTQNALDSIFAYDKERIIELYKRKMKESREKIE